MEKSLPAKLKTIKPGESIIIPTNDYRSLMRQIGILKHRGYCSEHISTKKALIIVEEKLTIGVMIINNEVDILSDK